MSDYENLSELALIQKSRQRDVKAFSELYARIHKELYKFALYTLKHPQDAEDAVSETVIAAYENIGSLKKEESFRSWIFQILSNQCKKRFRDMPQTTELEPDLAAPDRDYAQSHDVQKAFGILNEDERMIVAFSIFGGYQSDEIGKMMEQNPATVRSKKTRALEKMRKVLE
ncbi:MAG: RNA polymerase sigma factor [Muricomes sp.]